MLLEQLKGGKSSRFKKAKMALVWNVSSSNQLVFVLSLTLSCTNVMVNQIATIKSVDLLHLGLDKIMSVLSMLSFDATNLLRSMDTEHLHSMGNLFLFNSIHNYYTGKLIALTERASADMDIEHLHSMSHIKHLLLSKKEYSRDLRSTIKDSTK